MLKTILHSTACSTIHFMRCIEIKKALSGIRCGLLFLGVRSLIKAIEMQTGGNLLRTLQGYINLICIFKFVYINCQ